MRKSKIILILLWFTLTLSMAGWWATFALRLLESTPKAEDVDRLRSMIFWEGFVWMALLLIGGLSLIFYVIKEEGQARKLKGFVAAFSHDLKTSLASLRLQAESLKEDLADHSNFAPPKEDLTVRLIADTVRLELQLENSLFLARGFVQKLYFQNLKISDILKKVELNWPQMKLDFKEEFLKDLHVYADGRVLQRIFDNIIYNAIIHGQADAISVRTLLRGRLCFQDNGVGFCGNPQRLGEMFYRHTPSSGSGMGLYIVSQLMKDMGGAASFPGVVQTSKKPEGFQVCLEFKQPSISTPGIL